ncbi:hypothetical protein HNQ59_000387 [Chitinivorax tropicus]|uniref:Uncharacterized protein n=1 Tax=Chitinivorax tropicus TaxID=714531 RepID=A0A840MHX6_9PROT|nr:hypothetical protein [Chitinivorax tropicus]MBB5017125.1 hypothetical protein [Chitinivorax tropicus]
MGIVGKKQLKGIVGGYGPDDWVLAGIESVAPSVDAGLAAQAAINAALGGVSTVSVGGGACQLVQSIVKLCRKNEDPVDNLYFVMNDLGGRGSPCTKDYLKSRIHKQVFSGAVGTASTALSAVSVVDIAGVVNHTGALASTGAHLVKLHAIAKRYRSSKTIADWLALVIKLKAMKVGMRGIQLGSSFLGAVGAGLGEAGGAAATGLSGASAALGGLAGIGKIGYANSLPYVVGALSMEIHWRAHQEQVLLCGLKQLNGGTGPATQIIQELFTRRHLSKFAPRKLGGGEYNSLQIIREPGGWACIHDKLMML